MRGHGFYHGNAAISGRVAFFFYFQEADMGIAALLSGTGDAAEVARFRVRGGVPNPRNN